MFSESMKRDHWHEMGYKEENTNTHFLPYMFPYPWHQSYYQRQARSQEGEGV